MKIRQHRGTLADSMETVLEIPPTKEAISICANAHLSPYGVTVTPEMVEVKPYGFDERVGWDTHIVTIAGYGVFGMTDGPVKF